MTQYQEQPFILVVLNQQGEIVEIDIESHPSIRDRAQTPGEQEQLRQSRTKFNLTCTLIAVSAAFCFTGVGLFWSGHLSEDAALKTVDLLSRVVPVFMQLIEGKPPESEE